MVLFLGMHGEQSLALIICKLQEEFANRGFSSSSDSCTIGVSQTDCYGYTYIHTYIHTYIQTHGDSSTMITCLAFQFGNYELLNVKTGI